MMGSGGLHNGQQMVSGGTMGPNAMQNQRMMNGAPRGQGGRQNQHMMNGSSMGPKGTHRHMMGNSHTGQGAGNNGNRGRYGP